MSRILLLRTHDGKCSPVLSQPMGLLYIASSLRRHLPGRFEFRLIHTGFVENTLSRLKEVAAEYRPDYLFVSSLTPDGQLDKKQGGAGSMSCRRNNEGEKRTEGERDKGVDGRGVVSERPMRGRKAG